MQIEPNTFICADSIEVLREIKDKAFDLCLTDPPYGVGIERSGTYFKQFITKGWDCSIPEKAFFDEMFRVSEEQIIWGGNYFLEYLKNTKCFLVWDKLMGEGMSFADFELAWASHVMPSRIKRLSSASVADKKQHPTQKPVELFQWCLINYSKPGDLVIDPFCGSGTTALACHKTGRKFLCIDKDEEYIKIAQQRYADLIAQQDLFGENQDGALETAEGRGTACNTGSMPCQQETLDF